MTYNKIPEGSKKAFEGVLFKIYQWQQKMFDGSLATFEVAERRPSVDAIASVGDKIIVLWQQQPRREQEYPALPGGWPEDGEVPIDSIKRELLEETGYTSDEIIKIDEYHGTSKFIFLETQFVARNCQKLTEPQVDAGEKIRIELLRYEDFLQLCRRLDFAIPVNLRMKMYEALIDEQWKDEFKKIIFGK